jgi:RNA polymerase II subunit A C-terminal domain phosphatase SSU72
MLYAVICASNQNRSMEAHHALSKRGYQVHSYGTNSMIKLPGMSADRPNTYPFSATTTYSSIQQDLSQKNLEYYTNSGLMSLLERNKQIKASPERFQDRPAYPEDPPFDVIITCEERCFDIVGEDLLARGMFRGKPVWIVNFEIKDTPEDAAIGARLIVQAVNALEEAQGEDGIARVLDDLQVSVNRANISVMYTVHFT